MKKIFFIVLYTFIQALSACSTSQPQLQKWEGFTDNKMRVVVSEFFMPDETNPNAIPEQMIKDRVTQRASLLLASYININLPREKVSPESDALFNKLINDALAAPETIISECSENNFCTVITDFNIAPVNRELKK